MNSKKIKEIFGKYQSDLLKRSFIIEGEGSCLRLSVVEKILRSAISECSEECVEEPEPIYDFWGQKVE